MRLRRSQPSTEPDGLAVLGRRITEARIEAGLSKDQLAERLGVPLAVCEQYESGEVEVSQQHLGDLEKITGKPADWFRGEEPVPQAAAEPDEEPEPPAAPEPDEEAGPQAAAESDEEPEAVLEPDPDLDHTEEEQMAEESEFTFGTGTPPAAEEPVAEEPSAPADADDDDFSEDELTRVLSGLSRQRDSLAARRGALDAREQALDEREAALSEREDHIGAREDALGNQESSRSAQLDEEWQEKLTSFEETNRQYAAATTMLAEWAAELRGDGSGEPAAEAEPEAEVAEPESPPDGPDPDDFPGDDFPEDDL